MRLHLRVESALTGRGHPNSHFAYSHGTHETVGIDGCDGFVLRSVYDVSARNRVRRIEDGVKLNAFVLQFDDHGGLHEKNTFDGNRFYRDGNVESNGRSGGADYAHDNVEVIAFLVRF